MAKKIVSWEFLEVSLYDVTKSNDGELNKIVDAHKIETIELPEVVIDMSSKVIVKSEVIYEELKEDSIYNLRIKQRYHDKNGEVLDKDRDKLSFTLKKIEMSSLDGLVTYVFEKSVKVKNSSDITTLVDISELKVKDLYDMTLGEILARNK